MKTGAKSRPCVRLACLCGAILVAVLPAWAQEPSPTPTPAPAPGDFSPTNGDNLFLPQEEFDPLGYNPKWQLIPRQDTPESQGRLSFAPGMEETAAPPDGPLLKLAEKVVSSVVLLRAYDIYGIELARTVGFHVSTDGQVMTDASLIRSTTNARPAYITMLSADGQAHFVAGILLQDRKNGVLVLQSDATDTIPLQTAAPGEMPAAGQTVPVGIVAVSEEKGLLLADGECSLDETLSGDAWLVVQGKDSPGVAGSPVLDLEGHLLGIVGMQLKLSQWVNYAIPTARQMQALHGKKTGVIPLDRLKPTEGASALNDARLKEAWTQLYGGTFRTASSLLLRLGREYPRSPEVWALLGFASQQLHQDDLARNAFRRAAALDPALGVAWYGLAVAEAGDPAAASNVQESLEKSVASGSANADAWQMLARQRLRAGQFAGAAEAAKESISQGEGQNADCFQLLGVALGKSNDLPEAETAIRRGITLDPNNAESYFVLGLIQSRRSDTVGAIESYKRATQLNPAHPNAWMNLAQAYLKLGRRTEARVAAREHARLKPR